MSHSAFNVTLLIPLCVKSAFKGMCWAMVSANQHAVTSTMLLSMIQVATILWEHALLAIQIVSHALEDLVRSVPVAIMAITYQS